MTGLIDDNQEDILEAAMQGFADAQSRGQEPDIDEFVEQYPGLENQLRQRIRNLEKISGLFDCLVQTDEKDFENAESGQDLVGNQVGPYKLLSILNEGGMGIVYLAEQKHPIKRRVALKVIKPGMDSKRVIARFEAERQALALMDHPNIAQVHDAGSTEAGRPYFAMEHVKGVPITEYCDRHMLTIEERLELFLQVCEAVQHAHQKGIIHRDIKPSNIMVSIEANKSVPKIIDFGVAKALSQPLTERTLVTEQGQMLGTPEYMSPEQAEMTGEDIDTRSDIYSLGVLLYELLTGVLPFESEALRKGGISQVRKMICEEEPKTPSTRLSRLSHEKTKQLAKSRQAEVGALQRQLRSDLDWITVKAMEKDRTRRYASVGEFSADIIRHLNNEPVVAGPPSTLYRVKKFVRRHKAFVTSVAAVMAVLFGGIIISVVFAARAEHARAEAQAVSDFLLKSVLGSLDLWNMRGRDVTVRSILDAASQGLEGKLADEPLVEASIRWTLASSYTWLGLYEPAELHAKRALEIRRAELGSDHLATILSVWELGWLYFYASRYNEAAPLLTTALEDMTPVLDQKDGARLYCTATLGWVYNMQGRLSEAEQLFKEGLATVHRVWGEENEHSPTFLQGLGVTCQRQGRYEEAERLINKGLRISRRVRGEHDWETLNLVHSLGGLYWELGRYDQAEQLLVEALSGKRHVLGEQHDNTLMTMGSLGWLYYSQGRYKQAELLFAKALETGRRTVGEMHICSLWSMMGLGTLYVSQGLYDKAEVLLTDALRIGRRVLTEKNWATLEVMNTLANLYVGQEHHAKAEELHIQIQDAQRRVLGNDHPQKLASVNDLALLRLKQGHFDDANSLFHEALSGRQHKLGEDHPETFETKNDLGILHREQQQYKKAEELLKKALEGRKTKLGPDHPHTLESIHELAVLYKEQGDYDKAESLLREALEGRRLKLGNTHPHTKESLNILIDLYDAWNKPEKAAEWRATLSQTEAVKE